MRFTLCESLCDPSQYLPLAKAADTSGWYAMTVPDSICYPKRSDSKYPYNETGDRTFLDDAPFLEPFALIPALGAVTERVRFSTFVVKLPIRQPVLVAKQVTTVAVLTNNRLNFGVGLSPWPEDFLVCGQEWKNRGKRMDEMIEIIRGLATGEYFEYHGNYYDFAAIKLCPVPSQPIPILIGGHTEPALHRAARLGDGWMHAGGDEENLTQYIDRLKILRNECGRANAPFQIHVISPDGYSVDGVRRLEEIGVTDAIIAFRDLYAEDQMTLQEKLDTLHRFADDVISKVS